MIDSGNSITGDYYKNNLYSIALDEKDQITGD